MQQMWVSVSVCIAAAVIAGTGVHVAAGASNVRAGSDNCVLRNQDGTGCITEMAECKHGSFIFLAHDAYIGPSLREYGEWSEPEVADVFAVLIKKGDVVLDVGANIGTMTVPFAKLAGEEGTVHAFEPLRVLHNIMTTNAIINGHHNVVVHNNLVGAKTLKKRVRVPHGDFSGPNNYGSIPINVPEDTPGQFVDHMMVLAIDDLKLHACNFIKIDVEGHELEVLTGATKTIKKYKPSIYCEMDREDKNAELLAYLKFMLGYKCYSHNVPLFNPDNFKQSDLDIFKQEGTGVFKSMNAICVHKSKRKGLPKGLRESPIEVASPKTDEAEAASMKEGDAASTKEEL